MSVDGQGLDKARCAIWERIFMRTSLSCADGHVFGGIRAVFMLRLVDGFRDQPCCVSFRCMSGAGSHDMTAPRSDASPKAGSTLVLY